MAVRFLERATFGQTVEGVDELLELGDGVEGGYAAWVAKQVRTIYLIYYYLFIATIFLALPSH